MFSQKYIEELRVIHADTSRKKGFGGTLKKLGQFHNYMEQWKPSSVLDYGCGKGIILVSLSEQYPDTNFIGYDPAVIHYANTATNADCVFSNDVLEHIEPNHIISVLTHINSLSAHYVWLRIDTIPARKRLSDGRNAHLILESSEWWTDIIQRNISGKIVYSELTKKGKFDIAIEK